MAVQFASRLSLIAFAAVNVRGLIDGADFQGTIKSSLLALAVFYGLGLVFGELSRLAVEEGVRAELERPTSEEAAP